MNEVAVSNDTALMSFIERAAKDPDFDVAKFGELLRLQRDVGHDLARRSFNRAMAAAQSEMMPVIRSAQNKHLGNRYAKLEDVDREMRPIYTKHGFSVRFGSAPAPREGDIRITCTVAHEDGYSEENYLDAPASMLGSQGGRMAVTPVQAVGSVVTYLRRYLETMVFNVVLADDDDDGEGTRRAAAAPMPRAARVAERAAAYEASPRPHPQMPSGPVDPNPVDASTAPEKRTWAQWAAALEMATKDARTPEERGLLLAKAEVTEIVRLARLGQYSPAKARIIELYEEVENQYLADPPDPPAPEGEELPEVEIAGADKVAAGD